ncbi:aspartate aminotransferase family protein [Bacillota bacterium LX-D]|nr:aspartate aminotransferase family protein [Bacillota bacterium LX-D]
MQSSEGSILSNLYTIEKALELSRQEIRDMYKEYVNPGLATMLSLLNFDKKFVKAEGTKVWDNEGNVYLDFLGGYGALNFGHNRTEIIEAVEIVEKLPNILQASLSTLAAVLAYNLAQLTPGELKRSFFGNSGAEVVEGALKLARAATKRSKFVYCKGSFHGKSFGALSVTGREKYQKCFQPLLPDCNAVPYGDLTALEKILRNKDVAAFIVEPIQGEGGIIIPPKGYLQRAKELCKASETLLIVDEIQTGFGRTGNNFACELEHVEPDILCLAKSLGGGIMPIGAYITTERVWDSAYNGLDKALLHTSTFGGNARAAAAGIAACNLLVKDNLAQQAKEKGDYLLEKLSVFQNKYQLVKAIRGRGLMIGIEFEKQVNGVVNKITGGMVNKLSEEYLASLIAGELQNSYRIITAYTLNNPNVIRLEPPLTVSYQELDTLVNALEDIFNKRHGFLGTAIASGKTIINTIFRKN